MVDPSMTQTKFLMSSDLKDKVNIDSSLVELLPSYKIRTLIGFSYYIYFFYFKQWLLRFKYRKYKHYGQDCLYFSSVLNKEAIIIEDGDAAYVLKPFSRAYLKNILFPSKFKKMHGQDSFVKKMIISRPSSAPDRLKDKVIPFSFKNYWSELTYKNKNNVCSVFGLTHERCLNTFNFLNGKSLLLTQPLSEDGIITESEKVELYIKLIAKYNLKGVYIKTHPRESTVYSDYNLIMLDLKCPAQFFEFYSVNFNTVISLFSSSIHELSANTKILAGTAMSSKVNNKVGLFEESIVLKEK